MCFKFRQSHDQQMAFWNHRDSGWRSRTKLHQKHLFRDSEHTYNRCFWHVFGSMGFLQLEDRNSRTEHYQSQSRSLEIFRRFKGIRIGNSLNRDYTFSFSMKLSPQQLVYDQDANRSRRFILTLGASLNFIAKCFIQCFLFVDIWTATWSCFRIYLFQKAIIKRYAANK